MTDAAAHAKCRTCHRPRGENIAEGTRCARCGHRDGLVLWGATALSAANTAFMDRFSVADAGVAGAVAVLVTPPAFMLSVLIHELTHAAAALALGQTLTRVLVGEGVAFSRFGRDPQLVFGSVVFGNGRTTITDLRREGYVRRAAINGLSAPAVSAVVGIVSWTATADWTLSARTAALIFALANLALALATLMPVPTFGGRVWGDLAYVLYLRRLDAGGIEEQLVLSAQDRLAILVESGMTDEAVRLARSLIEVAPRAPLAHSLLAYVLHVLGRSDEAAGVASGALAFTRDPDSRAYLEQFLNVVSPPDAAH